MPQLDYAVCIHLEALEVLPKSGKRREQVIDFIRHLGPIAHLGGDFQTTDPESGRPMEVTEVGGYALTWWIDGPVREVKVVDIRSAVK